MRALVILAAFGLIASNRRDVNFDTATIGKLPPGWTVAADRVQASRWEIRRDRTAPSQPYVFAQVSSQADSARYPVAVFDGVRLGDGDISVQLKPVGGGPVRAGGVVFRYRDENNYYLARVDILDQNVALYKVENGRRSLIAAPVQAPVTPNVWRLLRVSLRGDRIQVYMSHRRVLQAVDRTFAAPGKAGLWTVGDAVTYFDDFRIAPR